MTIFVDARVPVRFGAAETAGPGDAVLIEGRDFTTGEPAHAPGCACCLPRGDAGQALGRLFLARARGEVAWFERVLVVGGEAAMRAALIGDPVASGRFRIK